MTLTTENLAPGQEQYEYFRAPGRMGKPAPKKCQYDYRHSSGALFSCIAIDLKQARLKRDAWMHSLGMTHQPKETTSGPMTDGEYADARDGGLDICPKCRSRIVMATGELSWSTDGDLATYPLECENCGNRWTEILRPVGYEMES